MTDTAEAPPAQVSAAPRQSRRDQRFEVAATIVLALTALATAWGGYQASLWDGIQSSNYSRASAARTSASQLRTEANQYRLADLSLFEGFIEATIAGDTATAGFYRQRFRGEFAVAFDAWMALDPLSNEDAPPGPMSMPEYQLATDREAAELEARAEQLFRDGEDANDHSDVYTLTTLLFAATLFFAAISERFEFVPARASLLVLASVGLIAGVAVAAGEPVATA